MQPSRRVRQFLIAIIVLTAGTYAAAMVHLMTQETELIFRTAAARADTKPAFPYRQIDVPRADGARQFAWRIERAAAEPRSDIGDTWVLFLHGNASTVASRMNVKHCSRLRELGLNVLARNTAASTASQASLPKQVSQPTHGPRTTTSARTSTCRRNVS